MCHIESEKFITVAARYNEPRRYNEDLVYNEQHLKARQNYS